MKLITEQWLNNAQKDLDVVQEIIHRDDLTNAISFHAQQAIEKSFKAVLEELEGSVPKIHSLVKLHKLIEKYIKLELDKMILSEISQVYTDSRYPGSLGLLPYGQPGIDDAKQFYEYAEYIFNNISVMLKKG